MAYQGTQERARKGGRTYAEQNTLENDSRKLRQVVEFLRGIAKAGETNRERGKRIDTHLAAQPRGPVNPGAKRPCRHNTTKQEDGWILHWTEPGFVCCRCCQRAPEAPAPESSPSARNASRILDGHDPADLAEIAAWSPQLPFVTRPASRWTVEGDCEINSLFNEPQLTFAFGKE